MLKSSKPIESREWVVPDFELPILPEIARRPPVLTMDQYFSMTEDDSLDFGMKPVVPIKDRCLVPFEM
jgi:hypothetical protein